MPRAPFTIETAPASLSRLGLLGVLAGVAAATATGTACSRVKPTAVGQGEAHWRPILATNESLVALPAAPPAERDLAELRTLVAQRSPVDIGNANFWNEGACLRWNEIARDLVAKQRADHTMASRLYALVSVAQYDALWVTTRRKQLASSSGPGGRSQRGGPGALFPGESPPGQPSEHAAVAGASAAVLAHLYPQEASVLAHKALQHQRSRLLAGVNLRSDIDEGDRIGRAVAANVIARALTDGAQQVAAAAAGFLKAGWQPPGHRHALDPHWGQVKPWLMTSVAQFRSPPPPPYDSPAFRSALAEVQSISANRTQEQKRLAALWADGRGSYAPAGRWNRIAEDLIRQHHLDELRAARVFALLNMALMDAGIAAWDTKYHYLSKRPSQVDPRITMPVEEPSSPSYTCSHAAFSGAAAELLAHLFPATSEMLRRTAEEAAMSRVYGGIQFRFEGDAGLAGGRAVARLAVTRARADEP
jgi:hypothetical protein